MEANYLSYNEIENYFGEVKIADRYKYLYDKMEEYIRARGLEGQLTIHEGMLQQTVMDYFLDIYRMKEFHKMEKADVSKILAYEAYWILRRKPIQPTAGALGNRLMFANEGFVTTLFAHEFLIPSANEPLSKDGEEKILVFLNHLNYHLKYRNVDKKNLELMLYAFQTGKNI